MFSSKPFALFILCIFFITEDNEVHCKYNLNYLETKSDNFKFSFQNCEPSSDPFQVKKLSLSPDPIKLPGNVTASGKVSVTKEITGPLTVLFKSTSHQLF